MIMHSDPIALAEQQVVEARTAVLAEYYMARAKLNRRAGSPVFIGGVLLGAVALGYFTAHRGKAKRTIHPANPGAWSLALNTARVLLPLLMALGAASRSARAGPPPALARQNNENET